jgi:hypothetical protein
MQFNLAHNLLSVDTNLNHIYYLIYALVLDDIVKGKSKYNVKFLVENDITKTPQLTQKFDFFWGRKGVKSIYYEHPLFPGVKAKLLLDMSKDTWTITVNRSYYKFAKARLDNVWPPGLHFSNLITIKLLQEGIITLHCGSFSNKFSKGFLIFGPSDTGKSLTTFAAIKNGYSYHSEDLTFIDKDYIYTSPLISGQSDKIPDKDLLFHYDLFIKNTSGISMVLPFVKTVKSFRSFFRNVDLTKKAQPRYIFILEKGKDNIKTITKSEAIKKILLLNRLELTYFKDHLFRSYSYFNKDLNLEKLMNIEEELIDQIVGRSRCYLVTSDSPKNYLSLINTVAK